MNELKSRDRISEPTPIQTQCWPAASQGYDIVGIAETGSGKTLAYVLPMLVHTAAQEEVQPGEGPIGLVLVPTKVLCGQVADLVQRYVNSDGNECGFKCLSIFGSTDAEDLENQTSECARRCDVMVATPGRLRSLLASEKTNLDRCTYIVLDEADELLKDTSSPQQGYRGPSLAEQIRDIITAMREDRQVLL